MKLKPILIIVIFSVLIGSAIFTAKNENEEQTETIQQPDQQSTTGLKPGSKAPDFTFITLDEKQFSLSDFKGKKVILNFWATWCPPCREEMPEMQRFYEEYEAKGVKILAVNLRYSETKPNKINDFIDEYSISFPIPLDERNTIGKQYRAVAIPTSYFITENGIIHKMHVGPMDYEFLTKTIKEMNE
jgi:peroxiredoxin